MVLKKKIVMLNNKILVTGGTGLVGEALHQLLPKAVYINSADVDLTNQGMVNDFFDEFKFQTVIHLAARVGGIQDNIAHPAELYTQNIQINTNVLDAAYKNGVTKFVGMLSTCIYPNVAQTYPMPESAMHAGAPAPSNFGYAIAKRALETQVRMYNKQYGTNYYCIAPCNLYGPNDKYEHTNSHFVAALIRKIHEAKVAGAKSITLFGDGTPLRQFALSNDLAQFIIKTIAIENMPELVNFACSENLSIDAIARTAIKAMDAEHLQIEYDTTKPNGQHRKDASNELMLKLVPGFEFTSLHDGIKLTYEHYLKRYLKNVNE